MISVYIADDEVWITIGLKKLIQKSGLPFEVIGEAHNGVTTLEDIKTLKPDVLFTDIRMPGLSGLEVMSYISEHQFAPPAMPNLSMHDRQCCAVLLIIF